MKQDIYNLLEELLPLVDLNSDFLFSELDSLGITQILMVLSEHYGVELTHEDVTPRNFKNLDSLAALVQKKLGAKS